MTYFHIPNHACFTAFYHLYVIFYLTLYSMASSFYHCHTGRPVQRVMTETFLSNIKYLLKIIIDLAEYMIYNKNRLFGFYMNLNLNQEVNNYDWKCI